MVDFCNSITSAEGKEVILNEWKATGIYDAITLVLEKCQLCPYHDIDPLVNESNIPVTTNLEAVCQLSQDQLDLFYTKEDKDEDDNDEEVMRGNQKSKLQTHSTFFRILMTSDLGKIIFLVVFLNIIHKQT